jgi:hypothetical protein
MVRSHAVRLHQQLSEILFMRGMDADAQATAGVRRIYVDNVKECSWHSTPTLDVRTALRLLRTPLRLLLEDKFNDGAFVRKMMPPERQARLHEAIQKGWIEMEHGGGIDRMRARALEVAEDPVASARMWVMSDNDGRKRSNPSSSAKKLGEACAMALGAWPVAYHRLERRSIENYLPGGALASMAHRLGQRQNDDERRDYGKLVRAFMQLTEEQKHFYNMKSGLLGDVADAKKRRAYRDKGHEIDDVDLPEIFRGLSREVKADLRIGFGADVASMFHDEAGVAVVTEAALAQEVGRDRQEVGTHRKIPSERTRLVQSLFESM